MSEKYPSSEPTQAELGSGKDLSQRVENPNDAESLAKIESHYRDDERILREAADYAISLVKEGKGESLMTTDELANAVSETVVGERQDGTSVTLGDYYSKAKINSIVQYLAEPEYPTDGSKPGRHSASYAANDAINWRKDTIKQGKNAVTRAEHNIVKARELEDHLKQTNW